MERSHNFIKRIRDKVFTLLYRTSFLKLGKQSTLCMPFSVNGAKYISIDNQVFVKQNAWFLALENKGEGESLKSPKICIGKKTYIGRNAHFVALKKIEIGDEVLMGDNVYIADNFHQFKNGREPYKNQGVGFKKEVKIGQGTWLGENVCVISAHIGKQCVIGANSVVLHDIPDYSIAVGSPAKVIRTFDLTTNQWIDVKNK